MKQVIRIQIPLITVKITCVLAVLVGIFFCTAGRWPVGLCMLLGAYVLERSRYRCPNCHKRLDMKRPVFKASVCPACRAPLRP